MGVQFISFGTLARDIEEWAHHLASENISFVSGIPRSGMTVAHMLAVHLNVPCTVVGGPAGRQTTARPTGGAGGDGVHLIVDDCCSYGTTINEFRRISPDAKFAAVYSRDVGRQACDLDYYWAVHREPDWLVVTEWNWAWHQDRNYIAVTGEVLDAGLRHGGEFDAVYRCDGDDVIRQYRDSAAALLVTNRSGAFRISQESGKPVLHKPSMTLFHGQLCQNGSTARQH